MHVCTLIASSIRTLAHIWATMSGRDRMALSIHGVGWPLSDAVAIPWARVNHGGRVVLALARLPVCHAAAMHASRACCTCQHCQQVVIRAHTTGCAVVHAQAETGVPSAGPHDASPLVSPAGCKTNGPVVSCKEQKRREPPIFCKKDPMKGIIHP